MKWIPLDDGLPAMNERVLVSCHAEPRVSIAERIPLGDGADQWEWCGDSENELPTRRADVSHWMPIPEAPAAEPLVVDVTFTQKIGSNPDREVSICLGSVPANCRVFGDRAKAEEYAAQWGERPVELQSQGWSVWYVRNHPRQPTDHPTTVPVDR